MYAYLNMCSLYKSLQIYILCVQPNYEVEEVFAWRGISCFFLFVREFPGLAYHHMKSITD